MKTVADSFKEAPNLLRDLIGFEQVAMEMRKNTLPYAISGSKVPLPRYISTTSVGLRQMLIPDFALYYPNIEYVISNGKGSSEKSFWRLHDAVFKFNEVQQFLHKCNCVVMQDKEREDLSAKLADVITDIVVFILCQYRLRPGSEEVTVSIASHCEQASITPDVFYGLLLDELDFVNGEWYAYEEVSPYCQALEAMDSQLMSELEEHYIPFTDTMAMQLLSGKTTDIAVRSFMSNYMKGTSEKEIAINPTGLLTQMKLQ